MIPARLSCIALVVAAGVFMVAAPRSGERIKLTLTDASGSFSFTNSRDGSAIFSASNMAPGNVAGGNVTIANTGGLAGQVTLSLEDVVDAPGALGGLLSSRVNIVVRDVTGSPFLVYEGKLATMPDVSLGSFQPGASRTYSLTAAFPAASGSADNPYAGASLSVRYDWTAVESAEPTTTPPPAVPEAPPTTTPPPASPDRQAPRVTLQAPKRQRGLRRGLVLVFVACDERCALELRADWRIGRVKGRTRVRRVLAPSVRTRVSVRANRRVRKALAGSPTARKAVKLRLQVAASDTSGNTRRVRKRIALRLH